MQRADTFYAMKLQKPVFQKCFRGLVQTVTEECRISSAQQWRISSGEQVVYSGIEPADGILWGLIRGFGLLLKLSRAWTKEWQETLIWGVSPLKDNNDILD